MLSLTNTIVTNIVCQISGLAVLRFINVAFKIMPGAALVFDMPETVVGPNSVRSSTFISVASAVMMMVVFRDRERDSC